jgi:hypothetical protein
MDVKLEWFLKVDILISHWRWIRNKSMIRHENTKAQIKNNKKIFRVFVPLWQFYFFLNI